MWQAIQASGREMVLTVEGDPDYSLMSAGGLGNAKRVGHDISPLWGSMMSLVDIGSGLWPWPHNGTNTTTGGYFNDLVSRAIAASIASWRARARAPPRLVRPPAAPLRPAPPPSSHCAGHD